MLDWSVVVNAAVIGAASAAVGALANGWLQRKFETQRWHPELFPRPRSETSTKLS